LIGFVMDTFCQIDSTNGTGENMLKFYTVRVYPFWWFALWFRVLGFPGLTIIIYKRMFRVVWISKVSQDTPTKSPGGGQGKT
jgi:hypothetical protein